MVAQIVGKVMAGASLRARAPAARAANCSRPARSCRLAAMPSVIAILKVKKDKVDEARRFLNGLAAKVRANEPGTQAYVFHQRKDDPSVFVAYEKYVDDAAFKTHGKNLASEGAGFAALLDGRPEIVLLDEI
jgi:quinol monooxygenase YgiN